MRILIFSDTHGRTNGMDRAIAAIGGVDAALHAGDIARDADYLKDVYDFPVCDVLGNNDFTARAPYTREVELSGVRFFLAHGHTLRVKQSYSGVLEAAVQCGAAVAVFGHTHVPVCRREQGVWLINPGSMMYADPSLNTFGIVEIESGKISADILKESNFLS